MKSMLSILLITISFTTYAEWSTSTSEDEMSGLKSYYALSPQFSPTKPMTFPYKGTVSSIVVACNEKGDYWAYFYFSKKPNISNDETQDGYSISDNRFKVDDDLKRIGLSQSWGEKSMHVIKEDSFIDDIRHSDTILLELDWHDQGNVVFKYENTGSKEAIESTFKGCGILNNLIERDRMKEEQAIAKAKEKEKLARKLEKYEQLKKENNLPSYRDLSEKEQKRLQMMFKKDMTEEEKAIWETR